MQALKPIWKGKKLEEAEAKKESRGRTSCFSQKTSRERA